jgi:hypothetical protein
MLLDGADFKVQNRMRMLRMLVTWLAMAAAATAQSPQLDVGQGADAPIIPMVKFEFQGSGVRLGQYAVSVDSTGSAAYESRLQDTTESGAPYSLRFTVSEKTRDRIFELARRADHFKGDFDYTKVRVADTGRKTLIYADPNGRNETTYNWSENQAVQELTRTFQGMANTIESGRRLEKLRRHDRLGIDAELRHMEDLARMQMLSELHIIAPILRSLLRDERVMRVSRQRILRLMQAANVPTAEGTTAGT